MELALYAPGLGYYSAGSVKIGPGGDFITAPEVSALFSRCVARQCAEVLRATGGEILELGAGTGSLAAALLSELAVLGVLPQRYAILEVSADLAARQRARLARLPQTLRERIVWLERLPERPLRGLRARQRSGGRFAVPARELGRGGLERDRRRPRRRAARAPTAPLRR